MNFGEIKKKTQAFVRDELFTLEPWILNVGWEEKLPKLNELREKVKSRDFGFHRFPKNTGVWD